MKPFANDVDVDAPCARATIYDVDVDALGARATLKDVEAIALGTHAPVEDVTIDGRPCSSPRCGVRSDDDKLDDDAMPVIPVLACRRRSAALVSFAQSDGDDDDNDVDVDALCARATFEDVEAIALGTHAASVEDVTIDGSPSSSPICGVRSDNDDDDAMPVTPVPVRRWRSAAHVSFAQFDSDDDDDNDDDAMPVEPVPVRRQRHAAQYLDIFRLEAIERDVWLRHRNSAEVTEDNTALSNMTRRRLITAAVYLTTAALRTVCRATRLRNQRRAETIARRHHVYGRRVTSRITRNRRNMN
jgi:hypothetical protein